MSVNSGPANEQRLVLPKASDIVTLIKRVAHPDFEEKELINLYFTAVDRSNIDIVLECLAKGVNINTYDMSGRTIFHIAAANGSVALVRTVIDWPGRNLDARTFDFMFTPLHEAILTDRDEIVEIFLNAGAKANVPNGHGSTAMHLAVKCHSPAMVKMLLAHKANLNVINRFSDTPLSIAILSLRDYNMSHMLLKHGARVNRTRPHSLYIFHEAVLNSLSLDDMYLLKLLVKHGAFINYVDQTGRNALHYAAICGMPQLMRYLLLLGVKTTVRDKTGRTPYDMARQHGHWEACAIIREYVNATEAETSDENV